MTKKLYQVARWVEQYTTVEAESEEIAIEVAEDLGDWDHGHSMTECDEIYLGHQVVEINL